MEIKIKQIGWNKGTVGWLSKGLESGELKLTEGTAKSNGNHGLWLEGSDFKQLLAIYNYWNLSDYEVADSETYKTVTWEGEIQKPFWTDAAWTSLMDIAQQWCDICNAERANDKPISLGIISREIEEPANV